MTHKTVPRSPTPQMLQAARLIFVPTNLGRTDTDFQRAEIWQAMYDAVQPTLAAPATDEILDEFIKEAEEQQEARISAWRRADDMTKLQQQAVRERDAANDRAAVALHAAADAYRQGCLDMREAAVKVCEDYGAARWAEYKRGTGPKRADPHVQGLSCGAEVCADAIRVLPLEPPK